MDISDLNLRRNGLHAVVIALMLAGLQYWGGTVEISAVLLGAVAYLALAIGFDIASHLMGSTPE